MSVLESPPFLRSSPLQLVDLEHAFLAWAQDPTKPDVVDLGQQRQLSMLELLRHLAGSQTTLTASACTQVGVPAATTIGTAAAELLHATVDPDGPRCRSFRSASYYLRGLIRLDADLQPGADRCSSRTTGANGEPRVR